MEGGCDGGSCPCVLGLAMCVPQTTQSIDNCPECSSSLVEIYSARTVDGLDVEDPGRDEIFGPTGTLLLAKCSNCDDRWAVYILYA